MSRSLSVVLKTAERCNIKCKYCYFFFGGDESFKSHPKTIAPPALAAVSRFLQQGVDDLGLDQVHIVIHGGEPMLQRPRDFDSLCAQLTGALSSRVAAFSLSIQTNGTLIDEEWTRLFVKHQVRVGISLDGPQALNDYHRTDHLGRGTYDRTVRGLRQLQRVYDDGELEYSPAVLCVINPSASGREVFQHFTQELGVTEIDFLLPDANPDSKVGGDPASYARFLCEVFDAWRESHSSAVEVKFFSALLQRFAGKSSFLFDHAIEGEGEDGFREAITIASDGSLWPDDSMRSTALWQESRMGDVWTTPLVDCMTHPIMAKLQESRLDIPTPCAGCLWENICGGGFLQNRWSAVNGCDNASVYCSGLKEVFLHVASYMATHGLSRRFFTRALDPGSLSRRQLELQAP